MVTTLQEMTPADYQARIVGLLESLGAAMPGVGYLIGGALVALGSPRTAYAVAGAGSHLVLAALVAAPEPGSAAPSAACRRSSPPRPARTRAHPRALWPERSLSTCAPERLNLT